MGWLACPQRVWWWVQGGAGCSSDGQLCRGEGDVVRVVAVAAATRLGLMGSVSCVGDGVMLWQVGLHVMKGVMVGKQGWPLCM